jgi:hypothetical protein
MEEKEGQANLEYPEANHRICGVATEDLEEEATPMEVEDPRQGNEENM